MRGTCPKTDSTFVCTLCCRRQRLIRFFLHLWLPSCIAMARETTKRKRQASGQLRGLLDEVAVEAPRVQGYEFRSDEFTALTDQLRSKDLSPAQSQRLDAAVQLYGGSRARKCDFSLGAFLALEGYFRQKPARLVISTMLCHTRSSAPACSSSASRGEPSGQFTSCSASACDRQGLACARAISVPFCARYRQKSS